VFVASQPLLPSRVETRYYLVVPGDGEAAVLQLLGRKVRQDIGYISGGIGSGGERKLLVAVTGDGHFPTQDIELCEPVDPVFSNWTGTVPKARGNKLSRDVRYPSHIRERAIVESSVWQTHRFQLFLHGRLGSEDTFGLVFRYPAELRRAEQLHAYFLGSRSDFRLNVDGRRLNGTDDNVDTGQSLLDGVVFGIVDLDHLGVALNSGVGSLSVHNQCVVLSTSSSTTKFLVRLGYFTWRVRTTIFLTVPAALSFRSC
jgi:hypothetical protein